MPKPQDDTQYALTAFQNGKSHRATCAALGLDYSWRGTVHRIIHGFDVGRDKENMVRERLGLPPVLPPNVPVAPCPSCAARGIVRSHGDNLDCHGQPVAAVAVLAPGQTVATQRPPRQYSRIADMPVSLLARAIKERRSYDHYD